MALFTDTPIEYLKGVGPQRGEMLKKGLNIYTFGDLLTHYPFRYVDKSRIHKIAEIKSDQIQMQFYGKITFVELVGNGRGARLVAQFTDDTGTIELLWFQGLKWIKPSLTIGATCLVFGKPSFYKGKISITHPEIDFVPTSESILSDKKMQPVYSTTEKLSGRGLSSRGIEKIMRSLVETMNGKIPEIMPLPLLHKYKLPSLEKALKNIHFPANEDELKYAGLRLKFDEFFMPQLQMTLQRNKNKITKKGFVFEKVGEIFNTFYQSNLPFELTNAQKRVLKEIRNDTRLGGHMNRLLQGDVGSGKTVVALLAMLLAKDNGFQSTIMAPTEILATQHFYGIVELLGDLNVNVALLTGSTKQKKRREIHEQLMNGTLDILIGTHALIEPKVKFHNLGLAIIDEQHRFGVEQRAKLWKKNILPPHILVMTATPIPRTLAMTVYGDLEISVIDELPPGRKPIKTLHFSDNNRLKVFGFMQKQIALGRQVYIVYPLIEESEKLDYKDLMDGYESICRAFPRPQYQVSIVHGKMKPEDKEFEMQRFKNHKTQIMVATTVIEVGVNVPNATVMIIESAERFGLSQLHQLRGRVGRGSDKSYCILMTGNKLSAEAKRRMQTMVATTDGFRISEVDLDMRGPGDLMGKKQSGILDFKIANLSKDQSILKAAKQEAELLLNGDPKLQKTENIPLKVAFLNYLKSKPMLAEIS